MKFVTLTCAVASFPASTFRDAGSKTAVGFWTSVTVTSQVKVFCVLPTCAYAVGRLPPPTDCDSPEELPSCPVPPVGVPVVSPGAGVVGVVSGVVGVVSGAVGVVSGVGVGVGVDVGVGVGVALPASVYVQVIVTGPPAFTPVTTPLFTLATVALSLLQLTTVAPAGGFSCLVSPTVILIFSFAMRRNLPL